MRWLIALALLAICYCDEHVDLDDFEVTENAHLIYFKSLVDRLPDPINSSLNRTIESYDSIKKHLGEEKAVAMVAVTCGNTILKYNSSGFENEAIAFFDKAIDHGDVGIQGLVGKLSAWSRLQRFRQIVDYLKRYLRDLKVNLPDLETETLYSILIKVAMTIDRTKNYEEAKIYATQCIEKIESKKCFNLLGTIEAKMGLAAEAKISLTRAWKLGFIDYFDLPSPDQIPTCQKQREQLSWRGYGKKDYEETPNIPQCDNNRRRVRTDSSSMIEAKSTKIDFPGDEVEYYVPESRCISVSGSSPSCRFLGQSNGWGSRRTSINEVPSRFLEGKYPLVFDDCYMNMFGEHALLEEPNTINKMADSSIEDTICILSVNQDKYFDWLANSLPRIAVFMAHRVSCKIYLQQSPTRTQKQHLAAFGLKRNFDWHVFDEQRKVFANRIFHIQWEDSNGNKQFSKNNIASQLMASRSSLKMAKQKLLALCNPLPENGNYVIYVSREGAKERYLKNEDALLSSLQAKLGDQLIVFKNYTQLDFIQQATLFSQAAIIVGPHGGGLSNMMFSRPKTVVIEFPLAQDVIYQQLFAHLATALDLIYYAVSDVETSTYSYYNLDVPAVAQITNRIVSILKNEFVN